MFGLPVMRLDSNPRVGLSLPLMEVIAPARISELVNYGSSAMPRFFCVEIAPARAPEAFLDEFYGIFFS